MTYKLGDLAVAVGAVLRGDPETVITHVATLEDAGPGAISFLANRRYKKHLGMTAAEAVILAEDDAADCPVACLITDNPYLCHARVMDRLYPEPPLVPGIHPTAVVDVDASVDPSAQVCAQAVVGPGVSIGPGVFVGPGCILPGDAIVGAGSRLVATVTIAPKTRLGARCLIFPGAVIGADGFGLANDDGTWVRVNQIGGTILGDDVEIGSCSSVDRGAIGNTVLADGVKIDSQVHVAHNVEIGQHTAMAGCSGIAGSSRIGAHCTIAGAAAITGHVELADHVHISAMTGVSRSLTKPGVYTSTPPIMEHAAWLKNFARLRQLDDMVRRVKALEKELASLKEKN